MVEDWMNWSGSLRFAPGEVIAPGSEDELARVVEQAAGSGGAIRVVGAGHSSSPLVATDDTLISLQHLCDIEIHDAACGEATIGAGVTLHEAGKALLTHGLAFANLGDIDTQTAIGAFATGTHGTGAALANLSAHLVGGRVVTSAVEFVTFTAEKDPDLTRAAQVSLGVIGIMTAARVRLIPEFELGKRTWCARVEDCLTYFDELAAMLRNVDFYWYPRSDEVKIRTMDPVENTPAELPFARLQSEETGRSNAVIPNVRELRFEEMECAVPVEAGLISFGEVWQRSKERWRQLVGWRVLYRTVPHRRRR
jgi:FAD/FMN-containing dehydrogenase